MSQKNHNNWLKYSGLGFQMIVLVIAGVSLGKYLDGKYNPEGQGWTLTFTLIAIVLSIYFALKDFINPKR